MLNPENSRNILLSLPHLLTRRTNVREPSIDYSHNHVVTSKECLIVMQQKAMDREVAEHIKETRRKEKQDKQAKKAITSMIIAKWVFEKELTRQQVVFITTWSFATIKGVGNKFHPNFKEGMRIHPLGYKGVNLG
jgi:hypothetical protein